MMSLPRERFSISTFSPSGDVRRSGNPLIHAVSSESLYPRNKDDTLK